MHTVANMSRFTPLTAAGALLLATVAIWCSQTQAGGLVRAGAVGGVSIDAEGVLAHPEVGDHEQLQAAWQSGLAPVPQDLAQPSKLRFISLRQIEQIVADKAEASLPLPEEVELLAGLQRVQYVLVYPAQGPDQPGDIVLAGPAEGWKVDRLGNIVGQKTNRPVLALEDLMVALRAAMASPGAGMSCSIDPTQEGLQRVQQVTRKLTAQDGPQLAARRIADALGYQTITVTGVPASSHFARTMVAADFRMKRLAMGFEPAPVDGLPSYLKMVKGRQSQNMLPRWWLAADYQPLLRDEAGLAWELRGQGVQCLTEEDYVNAQGERQQSGKASGAAQKWANAFTERFEELANHDSSFGQLRNAIDLAVVTTLIVHQGLAEQVSLELPYLAGKQELVEYHAPRQVATQTTFIKQGGRWVISASGGVQISPSETLAQTETVAEFPVATAQGEKLASHSGWWWDGE